MQATIKTLVQRGPYGPRVMPAPRFAAAAATFNGVYLRPNVDNGGIIPAGGDMCNCPDIWIAGTTPVGSFQTALATAASYATSNPANLTQNHDNYIYVRGMNGTTTSQSRTVQLYYAPSGVIQWPGQWQNNVIKTDQGAIMANIANLAAGQIGVADSTFLWPQVPQPPAGSDHYCLFAQFNSADGTLNPFPDVTSQIDMAALVMNNLGWGWRNTTLVPGAPVTFQYEMPLTIAQNVNPATYSLFVTPTGFVGWTVGFTCSQADAEGKPILLAPTNIVQDGATLGAPSCKLNPGFNAIVTVTMENNGLTAAPTSKVPLTCTYVSHSSEVEEVVRRGLVDRRLMAKLRHAFGSGIGPTPVLLLGQYTYQVGGSNASLKSRRAGAQSRPTEKTKEYSNDI